MSSYRRKKSYRRSDSFGDLVARIIAFLVLGLLAWTYQNWDSVISFGRVFLAIILLVALALTTAFFIIRSRKKKTTWTLDDDKTLAMLKGRNPTEFEHDIAEMFQRLGYVTKVQGGANDGGVDVVANKDGKKYYIQCKKYFSREVTPHDVRDFLGAISNANNPADKGFFITTGNFTLMAEKAAEGNPRIELIDGLKLVEYFKLSYANTESEAA